MDIGALTTSSLLACLISIDLIFKNKFVAMGSHYCEPLTISHRFTLSMLFLASHSGIVINELNLFEIKGSKLVPIPLVKLIHKLDPVKPQGMEEGREGLHHHEDTKDSEGKDVESDKATNESSLDARHENSVVEHRGELSVGQGESPEAEVRGGV